MHLRRHASSLLRSAAEPNLAQVGTQYSISASSGDRKTSFIDDDGEPWSRKTRSAYSIYSCEHDSNRLLTWSVVVNHVDATTAARARTAVSVNAATRGTEFFDTHFSSSQNIRIGLHRSSLQPVPPIDSISDVINLSLKLTSEIGSVS